MYDMKPEKDTTTEENSRPIFLMNIEIKSLKQTEPSDI